MLRTLAIETSCDDTSLAIISYDGDTFTVETLLAYSQISEHQKYGGVLPEIASRLHSEKIIAILQSIGRDTIEQVDFISATTHPGLPGSLVVGKSVATMLSAFFHKPLVEVNHIYGHIFSILLERKLSDITFPMVILTASWGHNDIYLVDTTPLPPALQFWQGTVWKGVLKMDKIASSLDDASGEAFDKVSKMLGGPYPGWPRIAQLALKGKANADYHFKRIFLSARGDNLYPFSFSGMKSQVSFLLERIRKTNKADARTEMELTEQETADIAYEFQEATVEILAKRLLKAAKEHTAQTIAVAGGVSANTRLIEYLEQNVDVHFLAPAKNIYSTDNGAMIGVVGILKWENIV